MKYRTLLLPLFLLLALAASPGRLWAAEAVTVQLNWKHQFEFAAFYAAEQQGYYREAGLDVTIREGGPGMDVVREIVEKRADFGVGTSALVVDRHRGQPVVALAALMQHSPTGLLARKSNGVLSVHDLAGRPVAVDPHNRDEIEAYLLASGIPRDRIRLVDQIDWTLHSVDDGRVAAKVVYISNEPFLIRGREHEYVMLTPRSAGIDLFGNVLFGAEATVASRPGVAKAFREATLKGLAYALARPEPIADLILSRYNSQGKTREHLLFEAEQIRELTRPDIVEPGYMSPGRWRHVVDVYAGRGQMPADFDLSGFLYDAAPRALPFWLTASLAGLSLLLAASLAVLAKVRRLNLELRREIGERTQAEKALHDSEARYRELVDNANAIILGLDLDGAVTYFNEYAERFFGYTAEEILGRHVVGTIVPPEDSLTRADLAAMVSDILAHPENYQHNENENMTRDGRRVFVRWANKVILDADQRPAGISCIGQDITERRRAEETIRHLAFFDALTHLPNRRLLLDRLHQALALSTRNQRHGALLFIDLDNFKLLNDTHGHDLGDLLLVEVARRLQSCVREGDTVARLGGDEFVVMLEELDADPEEAGRRTETVAEKIIAVLNQPYELGTHQHHSGASIGITLFQGKETSIDELLKRADLAMYQAKASGRNTLRFFDPAMQAKVETRSRLEAELRRAARNGEFLFHYQPQVDGYGRLTGAEALVRWQHPERGLVGPVDFIGTAEETGLIVPIGERLLRQACEQLQAWAGNPATAGLSLSVNVSARQFHHPDFVEMVLANLSATDVPPSRLILEITESLLLENVDETIARMGRLKERGVRFSIDDFGTGYSSLSYLKRLPLDELKIDRSFVADIEADENDAAICAAFISLAHLLGLRVIAEGVETEEQRYFLTVVHDCDGMQGYLFGRPVPAAEIADYAARTVQP